MKKFYLVGSDISNSLSPKIHKIIFYSLKVNASYELFQIETAEEISKLLGTADGFNITRPFKESIKKFVTNNYSLSDSINTVTINLSEINAYSTDGDGFVLDAKRLGLDLSSILLIGYGGAAKSIKKALEPVSNKISIFTKNTPISLEKFVLENNPSLLINCTPHKFDIPFNKDYYDLNYINYNGISGIGMLIYQAILSAQIFLSTKIDLSLFSQIYKEVIG